jgi:hypothetical protein
MRVTAAAPEALISDSNQLAMALAFSAADGETYTGLNWTDADGNLYAAASWEARDEWVAGATQPLVRPAWDVDEIIDMVAATRAQAALVFALEPVAAVPGALTAIGGMDGVAALQAMGMTAVAPDETP